MFSVLNPVTRPAVRFVVMALCALVPTMACGSSSPVQPTPPGPPPVVDPPTPPPPPPRLGVHRILAFGDSMTAGTTSPPLSAWRLTAGLSQSYPFKLFDMLGARYTADEVLVFNAGQPGERASEAPDRFARMIRESTPEVVLIMDGANDLLGGANVSATVGAVDWLVRDALHRGVKVMLATLPPQRASGRRGFAAPVLAAYNEEIRRVATKNNVILVDLFTQVPLSMIGEDGLHPTEEGYQRIAEIFREAIAREYEQQP
jgi:lysophospholipase L1-like esterase